MRHAFFLLTLIAFTQAAPVRATDAPVPLARQVRAILVRYCARCHGADGSARGGFADVLNRPRLVASRLIVPGDLAASELLDRVRDGSMPPEGVKLRPTPEEVTLLDQWIRSGAPADGSEQLHRTFHDESHVLEAIRTHLRDKPANDRRYQRYFSLLALHNRADVTDADLQQYRAALAALVGCLGRQGDPVAPQALDPDRTILAVDLRRLGWSRQHWQHLLERYPYGLLYRDSSNENQRTLANEVAALADPECDLPYVRADWFVAAASRPPLLRLVRELPPRGGAPDNEPASFPDSIGDLVRFYQRDLTPEDVASELGLRNADRMRVQLIDNRKLLLRGLTPTANGRMLPRRLWESRGERTKTLFQDTAYELGLGTPLIP